MRHSRAMFVSLALAQGCLAALLSLGACADADSEGGPGGSVQGVEQAAVADDRAGVRLAAAALPTGSAASTAPTAGRSATSAASKPGAGPGAKSVAAVAGPLVPPVGGGYSVLDAAFARLYGPGVFTMDSLGNHIAGDRDGTSYVTSQRFRAPISGMLSSIRPYWAAGPGYAGGNGGTIRVRLVRDDGSARHLPDLAAPALATAYHQPALANGALARTKFDDAVSFPDAAALSAGTLYHLVFDNVDADPASNYVSLNYQVTVPQNGRPSRWLSGVDWAALLGWRPAGDPGAYTWRDQAIAGNASNASFYVPVLQVALVDGRSFGFTDMETGNVEDRHWEVTALAPVRERFTPKANRTVSGLSFATATPTGGTLGWELREGPNVLAARSVTETAATYAVSTALRRRTGVFKWYDVPLAAPITLSAGKTYDLVFTPQGASHWRFADERNGSAYRYTAPAAWNESQAQTYTMGSWLDANHWAHAVPGRASNWRVVLHLAP